LIAGNSGKKSKMKKTILKRFFVWSPSEFKTEMDHHKRPQSNAERTMQINEGTKR